MVSPMPMLAKSTETTSLQDFIADDKWVMEQKLDGHRVMLCSPGGSHPPSAFTRGGSPYTRKLPKEINDFRFPAGGTNEWVLDGELVDGKFYAFDLVWSPIFVRNPYAATLMARRAALETLLDMIEHPFTLVPQAKTTGEKIQLADTAIREGFEGLMLKRTESLYVPAGRTNDWLKLKFVSTADCVVLSVRDDGKDSVQLGVYHDGQMANVGRASLIGKEKNGTINVGDVVEVRYLYVGAGARLYQPTILHKRDDKAAHECTTGQLRFVNKKVLETL